MISSAGGKAFSFLRRPDVVLVDEIAKLDGAVRAKPESELSYEAHTSIIRTRVIGTNPLQVLVLHDDVISLAKNQSYATETCERVVLSARESVLQKTNYAGYSGNRCVRLLCRYTVNICSSFDLSVSGRDDRLWVGEDSDRILILSLAEPFL